MSCPKKRFATRDAAKRWAKESARVYGEKRQRAYPCPQCAGYHLTKKRMP
jgi:hypothetical protein